MIGEADWMIRLVMSKIIVLINQIDNIMKLKAENHPRETNI